MQHLKSISLHLIPWILLVLGIYFVPLNILNTDLSMIPGDMGDSRFNNYILEHGYKFFTGQTDKFWNAPFMYPYPNVIALSDNLLGALPVYTGFRLFFDRETAFQLWILSLYALNYICCYWALKKWSNHVILSAVGAYVFAFSIFTISQLYHVQVLPRFIVPLVVYWTWKYLTEKKLTYFIYLIAGLSFQFYCGVYLGFLLIYILLFLFISYLIVYRDRNFIQQFKNLRNTFLHVTVLIFAAVVLIPLMLPYWKVSKIMGMRKFETAFTTIPRLRSYFFTSPASKTWSPLLYNHSAYAFPDWWNHFLFIGGIPWLAILLLSFVFTSKKIPADKKKFIGMLSLSLLLSFIFCLNIGGFTLYRIIFMLPGFSSMRSIDRVINTEVILFVLVFVFVFKELSERNQILKWIVFFLPILIIIDNLIEPWEIKRYEKSASQAKIKEAHIQIKKQYQKTYSAFLLMPVETYVKDPEKAYYNNVESQLTVMLAAQELNIICVNGYSGFYPGNYEPLFFTPNNTTLAAWCTFNNCDTKTIQKLNEIGKTEISRRIIHLKAFNNKFVSAIEGENPIVIADKDEAKSWETFTLICFEKNECVLRANTNLFFSAQLDSNGELTASRPKIAAWETFTLIDLGNNTIALKASNGKYLSLDSSSRVLANSETIGMKEKFKLVFN